MITHFNIRSLSVAAKNSESESRMSQTALLAAIQDFEDSATESDNSELDEDGDLSSGTSSETDSDDLGETAVEKDNDADDVNDVQGKDLDGNTVEGTS